MENSLTKEYNDFMLWFEKNHNDMFIKYGRNISVPFKEGGGVTVNNGYQISREEQQKVLDIAHTYYEANTSTD